MSTSSIESTAASRAIAEINRIYQLLPSDNKIEKMRNIFFHVSKFLYCYSLQNKDKYKQLIIADLKATGKYDQLKSSVRIFNNIHKDVGVNSEQLKQWHSKYFESLANDFWRKIEASPSGETVNDTHAEKNNSLKTSDDFWSGSVTSPAAINQANNTLTGNQNHNTSLLVNDENEFFNIYDDSINFFAFEDVDHDEEQNIHVQALHHTSLNPLIVQSAPEYDKPVEADHDDKKNNLTQALDNFLSNPIAASIQSPANNAGARNQNYLSASFITSSTHNSTSKNLSYLTKRDQITILGDELYNIYIAIHRCNQTQKMGNIFAKIKLMFTISRRNSVISHENELRQLANDVQDDTRQVQDSVEKIIAVREEIAQIYKSKKELDEWREKYYDPIDKDFWDKVRNNPVPVRQNPALANEEVHKRTIDSVWSAIAKRAKVNTQNRAAYPVFSKPMIPPSVNNQVSNISSWNQGQSIPFAFNPTGYNTENFGNTAGSFQWQEKAGIYQEQNYSIPVWDTFQENYRQPNFYNTPSSNFIPPFSFNPTSYTTQNLDHYHSDIFEEKLFKIDNTEVNFIEPKEADKDAEQNNLIPAWDTYRLNPSFPHFETNQTDNTPSSNPVTSINSATNTTENYGNPTGILEKELFESDNTTGNLLEPKEADNDAEQNNTIPILDILSELETSFFETSHESSDLLSHQNHTDTSSIMSSTSPPTSESLCKDALTKVEEAFNAIFDALVSKFKDRLPMTIFAEIHYFLTIKNNDLIQKREEQLINTAARFNLMQLNENIKKIVKIRRNISNIYADKNTYNIWLDNYFTPFYEPFLKTHRELAIKSPYKNVTKNKISIDLTGETEH